MYTWHTLQNETEAFGKKLTATLGELGLLEVCHTLPIDHACIRLTDIDNVTALKTELSNAGTVISSVEVNGREISIIQLAEPITLSTWQTHGIELPYPKPQHSYADGWEHVEFVFPDTENTMDAVRTRFISYFPHLDINKLRAEYCYSEDEPHAEGDQIPNPTIGLKVHGIGIKFHARSIQEVVGYFA